MDDDLGMGPDLDEQTELDTILDVAVEHVLDVAAALERDDTEAADLVEERLNAIIPTDPLELRDLLDTAIETIAVERDENDELRDALERQGARQSSPIRAAAHRAVTGLVYAVLGVTGGMLGVLLTDILVHR